MEPKKSKINYMESMSKLVEVIQELSLARTVEQIALVIRVAARELTGADGVTFVLKEGDNCFYAEENAIAPLWKGRRFPLGMCISGICMTTKAQIIIEDIYKDERVPIEAYRPTFVKSLVMVPIRKNSPIGAIGNYWADQHKVTNEELNIIQALADSTSVAMENVQVYSEMENKIKQRTQELEKQTQVLKLANQDLERFSYTLSHDLRDSLNTINGFSQLVLTKYGSELNGKAKNYLGHVNDSGELMAKQIEAMLNLYKLSHQQTTKAEIDLSKISREILIKLKEKDPSRQVEVIIAENLKAEGDEALIYLMLQNLLSNAWKYSSKRQESKIEVGAEIKEGQEVFFVKDNGSGFNMSKAEKLFSPFQRLHSQEEFSGVGIGLASVKKIVDKHNGHIWAKSELNKETTFYFVLT